MYTYVWRSIYIYEEICTCMHTYTNSKFKPLINAHTHVYTTDIYYYMHVYIYIIYNRVTDTDRKFLSGRKGARER